MEKAKDTPDQTIINDIGTALRFVDEDYKDKITNLEALISNEEITFDILWMLFPPKEIVLVPRDGLLGQNLALSVIGADYGQRLNKSVYFYVSGQVVNHDGDLFGYGRLDFEIDDFEGSRRISDLKVFPMKYNPQAAITRELLIERGRRYLRYVDAPRCLDYDHPYALMEVPHQMSSGESLASTTVYTTKVVRFGVRSIHHLGHCPKHVD